MKTQRLRKAFWLTAIVFFLNGCAGYHPARAPWDDAPPTADFAEPDKLTLGSTVKVTLDSGEVYGGILYYKGPDGLKLQSTENPDSIMTLYRNQIQQVEVKGGATAGWIAVGVLGVIVSVLAMEYFSSEVMTLDWE